MTYNVLFPGLGISLKINPVIARIWNLNVYWYGAIISVAVLVAVIYTSFKARDFGIDKNKYLDAVCVSILFAIVSARLYYVIFYPGEYYKNNPSKVFNIFEGGLAIYGGIIGGIISGILVCKFNKTDISSALDLSSLGLIIGQSIGRWGNFFNQEAFGATTENIFRMVSEKTNYEPVHPCFFYESAWCFLGFIILHVYSRGYKKNPPLNTFLIYMLWYSFGRYFIEGIRSDSLMFLNLKISQILSLAIFMVSLIVLIKRGREHLWTKRWTTM